MWFTWESLGDEVEHDKKLVGVWREVGVLIKISRFYVPKPWQPCHICPNHNQQLGRESLTHSKSVESHGSMELHERYSTRSVPNW